MLQAERRSSQGAAIMDAIPGEGTTWLLTQGVLGLTTLLGIVTTGYLFRAREKDRLDLAARLDARDVAHDAEISSWIKLYTDAQAERLADQKLQNEKLASANDLVRSLYEAGRNGGQFAKVS